MGKKHSGAAFQSRLNQQRQRQPASSNNGVKGFVGGTTAVKERRVRFVRARRPDRPLVDVDLLRNVIVLNGDVAAFEDAGATMIAETHEHRRGMSTRGNDRGDDLYALCDVRMKWAGARRAGAGLANLGNTCFLNSVLQCLTHTPALANFALRGEHKKYKTGGSFNALYEIGEHVARALNSSGRTIAPTALVKNLRALSKTFRKGRQEDAHELARCLLDAMHKKCVEVVKPKISPNSARAETSFVWKVFGGRLRSQVNCKTCGRNSETFDPFLDLSLEVGRAKSVLGAFKMFTHTEVLDGDNKYRCEGKSANSKSHLTKASKQFTVNQAPNVLALQLKRFAYVPFGRGKLNHFVEYPLELDITPYTSDEGLTSRGKAVYDLYGVLVHAGNSSNSGHYYCFVKVATGTWCLMDDDEITSVSEKVVLKQQAYLLFYARRDAPGTFEEESTTAIHQNIPDLTKKAAAAQKEQKAKQKMKKKSIEAEVVPKRKVEPPPLPRQSEVRKLHEKGREKKRLRASASPIGKSIRAGRSKSPSVRSAFDSAKRALLHRRLKRLSVGVTLEDIPSVSLDSPVRTRNAKKYVSGGFKVKEWIESMPSTKWEDCDDDDDERESDQGGFKKAATAKRLRREYDQFDEEYDRGKLPKHKRRKAKGVKAPPMPRKSNPFQRRSKSR